MLSTCKPKSIQVIGFDKYNYDFLKKFRHDFIISLPDNVLVAQVEQNDAKNQKQAELPPATAEDVLAISDNAAKSMEVNTKEKIYDPAQSKIIEKEKPELSEEDLKRIKKPLGTIEQPPIKIGIEKDKDKTKGSSGGVGGGGGGGSNVICSQSCTTSCNIHGSCTTRCKTLCTVKN